MLTGMEHVENGSYISSDLTPTNCTIVDGGYCKLGANTVIVNIRIKVTANGSVSITGFPQYSNKASQNIVASLTQSIGVATPTVKMFFMYSNGQLVSNTSLSENEAYMISFIYICN